MFEKTGEVIESAHLIVGGPAGERAKAIWGEALDETNNDNAAFVFVVFADRQLENWTMRCVSPETAEDDQKAIMSFLLRQLEPVGTFFCNDEHWGDLQCWLFDGHEAHGEALDKAFFGMLGMHTTECRQMN